MSSSVFLSTKRDVDVLESPTKGHKNVEGTGASFSRRKAERAGTGQPGEEKAQRESDQCVQRPEERVQR